jgi:peptidoglycan/xylan/chitin deacetylase (PgdA/CDA1 family)
MKIPILMYHQIDETPIKGTPLRGLVVSPGSFSRQMQLLKIFGYKGLSMRDLEPYLNGQRTGKVVGITFDDGYENNLINALPILTKHGFTATCYGVSSMIGGTNSWDRHIGVEQKLLMTASDWQTWAAAGMDVGSHTRTHADLTSLDVVESFDQIQKSKYEMENAVGSEVRHFCYPYGRFNEAHMEMVSAAGYVTATTTRRGRPQTGDNAFALKRSMIARATSLALFAAKIMTPYDDQRR